MELDRERERTLVVVSITINKENYHQYGLVISFCGFKSVSQSS